MGKKMRKEKRREARLVYYNGFFFYIVGPCVLRKQQRIVKK